MSFSKPVAALFWLFALCVLLVLYGPLVLAVFFSFFSQTAGQVDWSSFSLGAYGAVFKNKELIAALQHTGIAGFCSVMLALFFGTIFAFYYERSSSPLRYVMQSLIFVPFLVPPIITGLSLLTLFREIGFPRSLVTVVAGHTIFIVGISYRIILSRLQSLSVNLVDASLDLGASQFQTLVYVVLPHLAPAIGSAAILGFALSFDETLITLLVTGSESTLPMYLYGMMRLGFTQDINALASMVLLATAALTILTFARFLPQKPD